MFGFKKKEKLTNEQKELLKKFILFYEMNKDIFVKYEKASERREIIKKIYSILNYTSNPKLLSETNKEEELKVYRGISAPNYEKLKEYSNDFMNGNIFFGARASFYGTGIYTAIGNDSDVAGDYASDGNLNDCGVIIESSMDKDTKIINNKEIEEIRNFIISNIKKLYKNNMDNYLGVLEDDGALSSIMGYDAILVEDKKYLVILNRTKMIVNDIDLKNKIDNMNKTK